MDSVLPSTSLRDLVVILFKRKWSIVTIVMVSVLSTLGYLALIKEDGYEITAKILVKIGAEQAPPSTTMGLPPNVVTYRKEDVNSEIDIIQSRELMAQVVDSLHLDQQGPPPPVPDRIIPRIRYEIRRVKDWARDVLNELLIKVGFRVRVGDREAAISMWQRSIVAVPQPESNIIQIHMIVPIRENANILLNTLLDHYLRFRTKVHRDANAVPFFRDEVAAAQKDLSAAENELHDFEGSANISALEKQKEVLLGQLSAAQSLDNDARSRYRDVTAKLSRLREEMQKPEPDFASMGAFERDSFAQNILLQLSDLQRERERMRLTELDASPRIQNNRKQFQMLIQMLTSNLQSVEGERETESRTRAAELARLEQRLAALHEAETAWTGLKRRVRVLEDSYVIYRKKLEESAATDTLQASHGGNVAIVEHATDPLQPAGMRKLTMLAISGAAGLLFALLWVTIVEFFDHTVHTPEAVEAYLGAPVIATIPAVKMDWDPAVPVVPRGGQSHVMNDEPRRAFAGDPSLVPHRVARRSTLGLNDTTTGRHEPQA